MIEPNPSHEISSPQSVKTDWEMVVTGICGRLGRRLARSLHRKYKVIGLDRREFPDKPCDIEHYQIDIRNKRARDIFRRGSIRALIHLGIMHDPRENFENHHAWNVLGLQRLLSYAEEYSVPKVLVLSSANVYGPRPDNPQFLTEDAPLLAAGAFSEIRDLVELDMCAQSFFWKSAQTETVILRPSHILGAVHNAPSNYFRLKVIPTLLGFDPMIQVVHQDDIVAALTRALVPGVKGIFNIAGPPPTSLSRAIAVLGRSQVAVPHTLARSALNQLFRWRIASFPAPELDYIRYVCMVDDTKSRNILGYSPSYTLEQTLRSVDDERWA